MIVVLLELSHAEPRVYSIVSSENRLQTVEEMLSRRQFLAVGLRDPFPFAPKVYFHPQPEHWKMHCWIGSVYPYCEDPTHHQEDHCTHPIFHLRLEGKVSLVRQP